MPNYYKSDVSREQFAQIPSLIEQSKKIAPMERKVADLTAAVDQQREDIADLMNELEGLSTLVGSGVIE